MLDKPPKKPKFGTRITPRTCLWPLAISLVITFGLSIGLTFRSNHHCYAGTCGETLFPLQARLHVVVWYMWLSLSTTFLAIRAFHPELQKYLSRHVIRYKIPVLKKNVSRGGLLMVLWILCLYATAIGVWWPRVHQYFNSRNRAAGIVRGGNQLAAIALTGHLCDITMGMVLLPISRHSALASFFQIDVSTTLANHVLAAYTLFTLVIIHGAFYASWVPVFNTLSIGLKRVIPVLNPTYPYSETWPGDRSSLGVWRASLIFTGCTAALIMVALSITTVPKIRVRYFNLFYFTHLLSIVMVVIICLHASTMFYCTAPGLAMWILDWGMRLYELRERSTGTIINAGRGWYIIDLSLPRARLTGCSCRSPIAHFYLHHSSSSIRELHPFTTITHLASQSDSTNADQADLPIQFLFRKQGPRPRDQTSLPPSEVQPSFQQRIRNLLSTTKPKTSQWTAKLASQTDGCDPEKPSQGIPISLRLEGPYFTPADPYRYNTTICLVAGSGVSGALAIGAAFNTAHSRAALPSSATHATRTWRRCMILWSIKSGSEIELPSLKPQAPGLEVRTFLTGQGKERVDLEKEIWKTCGGEVGGQDGGGRIWVYISGPKQYIMSAKTACQNVRKEGLDLDFYAASWDP